MKILLTICFIAAGFASLGATSANAQGVAASTTTGHHRHHHHRHHHHHHHMHHDR